MTHVKIREPSFVTRAVAFFVWFLLWPFMWRRRRKAREYPAPTRTGEVCAVDGCEKRCMIVSDDEPSRECFDHYSARVLAEEAESKAKAKKEAEDQANRQGAQHVEYPLLPTRPRETFGGEGFGLGGERF